MFIDAMGLILADMTSIEMRELTKSRALAAVPFAGRYRIIDFMLSSMVNSGIISVGVLTSHKYRSLMDHLGSGGAWDLSRKTKGLYILPPYVNAESVGGNCNDVNGLSGVLDFFKMNTSKYVIVGGSNVIFNTTFNDMIAEHEESGADVSIMYSSNLDSFGDHSMMLEMDKDNWIKNLYKIPIPKDLKNISLNVFVLKRELLIDVIQQAASRGDQEITIENLLRKNTELKMRGYEFNGTCLKINSVQGYFNATMSILTKDIREELFMSKRRIYTKVKDEGPSLYSDDCQVEDSLISDGCTINGKVVESMLFRNVNVSEGASLKNCIIMQNVHISEGCELENVIIDKFSILRPGIKLVGQPNYPVLIGKSSVV